MIVENLKEVAELLAQKSIEVDYPEHSWGKVAKFKGLDGNLITFKYEDGCANQVEDTKN